MVLSLSKKEAIYLQMDIFEWGTTQALETQLQQGSLEI